MAALLAALEHVLSRGRLRRNVIVVGEADEEMASVGVNDVIAHLGGDARRLGARDRAHGPAPRHLPQGPHDVSARRARPGVPQLQPRPRATTRSRSLARAVLALEELHAQLVARPAPPARQRHAGGDHRSAAATRRTSCPTTRS